MAQDFHLLAAARTLSLAAIYKGGEEAAYNTFKGLRWPETDGEPVCPHCGSLDAYSITTRRRFKCADCGKQYSVTSGTIFHSRKKSFTDLLAAACIIANAAKGLSALQLSRDLDCQHKTAWILSHKLREAMASETADATLSGEVEMDGMYTGGAIRPANFKENRVDRRRKPVQTGKRRVVIALRQRDGRTLTFAASTNQRALKSPVALSPRAAPSLPTKRATGMRCHWITQRSGSITAWRTAWTACRPIRRKVSSRGCVG